MSFKTKIDHAELPAVHRRPLLDGFVHYLKVNCDNGIYCDTFCDI